MRTTSPSWPRLVNAASGRAVVSAYTISSQCVVGLDLNHGIKAQQWPCFSFS
jgi:hypothetical protein